MGLQDSNTENQEAFKDRIPEIWYCWSIYTRHNSSWLVLNSWFHVENKLNGISPSFLWKLLSYLCYSFLFFCFVLIWQLTFKGPLCGGWHYINIQHPHNTPTPLLQNSDCMTTSARGHNFINTESFQFSFQKRDFCRVNQPTASQLASSVQATDLESIPTVVQIPSASNNEYVAYLSIMGSISDNCPSLVSHISDRVMNS